MPATLQPSVTLDLGGPTAQIRIAPLGHAIDRPRGFLVAHSGCAEVDPYHEMFFLPTDTLKLSAFDACGRRLWRRDLGPGMIPGIWFCPVLAYDLDGDDLDEVWVVNNGDPAHALNWAAFQLERMDAAGGEVTGRWPWPRPQAVQDMSRMFRNYLHGATDRGERRLISAQGNKGPMALQAYDPQMNRV